MHFVYILECADKSLYVGCTNNLDKRLKQHNESKSGAHYTKIRRPVALKYFEQFPTLLKARGREAEIKRWPREKKLDFIFKARSNPNMKAKTVSKPKDYKSVTRNSREHRSLAIKVARQADKVLPIFEKEYPDDNRPRQAIEAIMAWGQGKLELGMAKVRKLSLDSHAAAREAKTDAARFAARAAGQAVATWHVPNHALAVPYYVHKAIIANKKR